jgi:PhnB protein
MSTQGSEPLKTSIAPWLSVPDGGAALDFYKAAFGAVELHRLEDDAGKVVLAQLSLDGAEFWLQEDPGSSPATAGALAVRMIVTVDDPDSRFERAVAAGARKVVAVGNSHGWRTGRIADPFGHHWELARPIAGAA